MHTDFVNHYRDLEVYKLAFNLSLEIHHATGNFPKSEQYSLADQIRRSSKSVCANIAEGFGRQQYSKAEFKRFLTIAIGSATETQVWLDYSVKLKYITTEEWKNWQERCDSVMRMLHKLRNHP